MKNKILAVLSILFLCSTVNAAQHDYNIANAPGATVRSDINNALTAIANNNSGATEPAALFANMWWFDTSTNLLKQRDNANSAWITTAIRSGTNWIPYRNGTAIGTAALLTTDTDTSLTANSDSNTATQKAVKSYADGKISKTTSGEIAAMTEKTTLVDGDLFLIEDSAASNAKKKVKKSNISNPTSQLFTGNGTFTAPTGITRVFVTMCGGGGGGAGGDSNDGGGGGGGAQCIDRHEMVVVPATGYTVTVGSAGAGGAIGTNGGAGGSSTFVGTTSPSDYTLTALGGNFGIHDGAGGAARTGQTSLDATANGAGGFGPYYIYGGGAGFTAASAANGGGGGGSSMLGRGGDGTNGGAGGADTAGDPGGIGAGGGGGPRGLNGGVGGNGGDGFVYIEW